MAEESEAGIDKREILAEIGASASLSDEPAKGPPSLEPAQPASSAAGLAPASSLVSRASRGRLGRHRRQIAALVMIFVAFLWLSVGLGAREAVPLAIGGIFLGLSILVGVYSLLR